MELSRAQEEQTFRNIRKSTIRQADRELELLNKFPDRIICPTCNGWPSSMGGRGFGLRAQAFCFTCKDGAIDFDTWLEYCEQAEQFRESRRKNNAT